MNEKLIAPRITNFSPEANYYRNKNRPKVDRLFSMKDRVSDPKQQKMFDILARKLWVKVVTTAEKMLEHFNKL
jgi:hypothetical protein